MRMFSWKHARRVFQKDAALEMQGIVDLWVMQIYTGIYFGMIQLSPADTKDNINFMLYLC